MRRTPVRMVLGILDAVTTAARRAEATTIAMTAVSSTETAAVVIAAASHITIARGISSSATMIEG